MLLMGIEILAGMYALNRLNDYRNKNKQKQASTINEEQSTKQMQEKDTVLTSNNGQHYLKVSSAGVGLAAVSYFYPTLNILNLLVISYSTVPIIRDAEHSLINDKSIKNNLLNAMLSVICLLTGKYFVAAICAWTDHLGGAVLAKAKGQSKRILSDVFAQQPKHVYLLVEGVEVYTPLEAVKTGDKLIVNTSQVVPIDGEVIEGQAQIDQHALTGESQPVEKYPGDKVFASTMVIAGRIVIRVQQTGEETVIAKLAKLVYQATEFKSSPQLQGEIWADKAARPLFGLFVLAAPFTGIYTAAGVLNSSPGNRVRILLPLENLHYLNIASHMGILIKDGSVLETLNKIDTVLFDKTGTLTDKSMAVQEIICFTDYDQNNILTYACSAESKMSHPIAKAIVQYAQERGIQPLEFDDTQYAIGSGITAVIEDQVIRIGSPKFIMKDHPELPDAVTTSIDKAEQAGNAIILVEINKNIAGGISIRATVRPEAKQMIEKLKAIGIKNFGIISGDSRYPTECLAKELAIEHVFHDVFPEQKASIVETFKQNGHHVCFVGDGINDAIAMGKADVSVSLSGATTIAMDSAQVILMDSTLNHLTSLFEISHSLHKDLQKTLGITFFPVALILGGSLFFNWGILASIIINNTGLGLGATYSFRERKIKKRLQP